MAKPGKEEASPYDLESIAKLRSGKTVVNSRPYGGSAYDLNRVNAIKSAKQSGNFKTTKRPA